MFPHQQRRVAERGLGGSHPSDSKRVFVVAHRGASALAFENTITAFRLAEKLGADAVELDVHLSKDGRLVVVHDPDLKRIAGVEKQISEMTYNEISQVRLPGNERIPDLETVIREVRIPLVIEIKTPKAVPALIETFEEHPECVSRCQVISFFHGALRELRARLPDLALGALLVGFPVDPAAVVRAAGANILSLNHEGLWKEYVDECHRNGVGVGVWTVNDEQTIRRMVYFGVDYITSDRPDLVLKLLSEKQNTNPQ